MERLLTIAELFAPASREGTPAVRLLDLPALDPQPSTSELRKRPQLKLFDPSIYRALADALGQAATGSESSTLQGLPSLETADSLLAPRTAKHIEQLLKIVAQGKSNSLLESIEGAITHIRSLEPLSVDAAKAVEQLVELVSSMREFGPQGASVDVELTRFISAHARNVDVNAKEAADSLLHLSEPMQPNVLRRGLERIEEELQRLVDKFDPGAEAAKQRSGSAAETVLREIAASSASSKAVLKVVQSLRVELSSSEPVPEDAEKLLQTVARLEKAINAENIDDSSPPELKALSRAIQHSAQFENLSAPEIRTFSNSLKDLRRILEAVVEQKTALSRTDLAALNGEKIIERQLLSRPEELLAAVKQDFQVHEREVSDGLAQIQIERKPQERPLLRVVELEAFARNAERLERSLEFVVKLSTELEAILTTRPSGQSNPDPGARLLKVLELVSQREVEIAKESPERTVQREVLQAFKLEVETLLKSGDKPPQRVVDYLTQQSIRLTSVSRELLSELTKLRDSIDLHTPKLPPEEALSSFRAAAESLLQLEGGRELTPVKAAVRSVAAQIDSVLPQSENAVSLQAGNAENSEVALRRSLSELSAQLRESLQAVRSPAPDVDLLRSTLIEIERLSNNPQAINVDQLKLLAEKLTQLQSSLLEQRLEGVSVLGERSLDKIVDIISKFRTKLELSNHSESTVVQGREVLSSAKAQSAADPLIRSAELLEKLSARIDAARPDGIDLKLFSQTAQTLRSAAVEASLRPQPLQSISSAIQAVESAAQTIASAKTADPGLQAVARQVFDQVLAQLRAAQPAAAKPHAGTPAIGVHVQSITDPAQRTVLEALARSGAEQLDAGVSPLNSGTPSVGESMWSELERIVARSREKSDHGKMSAIDAKLTPIVEHLVADEGARASIENAKGGVELVRRLVETLDVQSRASESRQGSHTNKIQILNQLEQIFRGQDFLSQLSPVMQSLGEPAFLIFPFVVQGLISKLEMALFPGYSGPRAAPDGKNGKSGSGRVKRDGREGESGAQSRQQMRMLKFKLRLPTMGDVGVEFAYTLRSAFVKIAADRGPAVDFLAARTAELEAVLKLAGFEQIECSVAHEAAACVRPQWVRDMLEEDAYIA